MASPDKIVDKVNHNGYMIAFLSSGRLWVYIFSGAHEKGCHSDTKQEGIKIHTC